MILEIAKWVVICFGIFIIFIGFVMLIAPSKARLTLRQAGSTNFINYAEITVRLIPAVSLILYADSSKIPEAFKILGWIMLITSLILYAVPRKIHHKFSLMSAHFLKPFYFQLLAPFAFLFGGWIIYNAL
ncbi:hypothetical protein FHG64_09130 [Antarcticibacterium flavum]|uniref:Uncharacterized protein n=1 Tax=Antarcticibacterium flavum TaxID=2058175 RepID=A0A5B7X475_9FLAO|nr:MULTISPECIES: hypothetical protein [Antarcticibacterium]MCM4159142.1 hypothetical protein [Antarcticibacterium sp. W02-3]QCY69542.1 hypothetical protein FHG64_09130 [Antarcticibacterium flavum]